MDVRFYYPDTSRETYPFDIEGAAAEFAQLLFDPDNLGRVVHRNFKEYLAGEGLSLDGLQELQEYRRQFGHPVLQRVNFFVVPPSRATYRLNGGGRFTFDAIMELNFGIPFDSLAPAWRKGLNEDDVVPVQLRMREPTYSRPLTAADEPMPGVPQGKRMIFERSYWPYLANAMGEPHDQIGHVAEQVAFYARTRTPMWTAPTWTPTWVAYNETQEEMFTSDPTAS